MTDKSTTDGFATDGREDSPSNPKLPNRPAEIIVVALHDRKDMAPDEEFITIERIGELAV